MLNITSEQAGINAVTENGLTLQHIPETVRQGLCVKLVADN